MSGFTLFFPRKQPVTRTSNSTLGNKGFEHLNGNLLCAIDCETTGTDPRLHEIVEIAIVPLDHNLERIKGVPPFHYYIAPRRRPQNIDEEAMKVNKLDLAWLNLNGTDPWLVADMLDRWFQELNLAPGRKIMPLGMNWKFDCAFLLDWLGPSGMDLYFNGLYRDLVSVALFLNDRSDFHATKCPFTRYKLRDIARLLGVVQENAHTAIEDALTLAQCYKRLMTHYIPNNGLFAVNKCSKCTQTYEVNPKMVGDDNFVCPRCTIAEIEQQAP
jgi:DNA polymerase III epsilon subunit-like protein